jgi:EAL domain-containing protein (putative c-di-GMP-specific phosphodiesterase class I)/ActR/RegA family two-component response regulator
MASVEAVAVVADGVAPDVSGALRALIVDDDPAVLRAHARVLSSKGYLVVTVSDGAAAVEALKRTSFDVVLSDINMPKMDGIELLQRVREHDLDVPVVLVTGAPSIDSAIRAVEQGALRYLVKPVEPAVLVKVVDDAVRLHRIAKAKRSALAFAGEPSRLVGDRIGLMVSFERAMDSMYVAFQPIVSVSKQTIFGYEVLLRTTEPTLPNPLAVLEAAERLGRVHELGRLVRLLSVEPLPRLAPGVVLFVNIHPTDLLDRDLFSTTGPFASAASKIVLEVTERACLDGIRDVRAHCGSLRRNGFRLALDDLGAGYAGLTSFALLEPDFVKLDMSLVRDLAREPTRKTLVRTMISMCKELGIMVIAEGIETEEERDELIRAGCDLMQGYLFARPGPPFPEARF